ncbi:SusC/RagA family TonB-linked outer membrane protein [Parapedobacter pyrenivorans]|uniref:SusC/RagA family TonB-linked outer membrane protein n=1 Tax=Parapedobacter pyrenivorans TaxID=1305674 RepID=UPI003342323F
MGKIYSLVDTSRGSRLICLRRIALRQLGVVICLIGLLYHPRDVRAHERSTVAVFQNWILHGTVVDERGEPLPGVSVAIWGTTNATSSDTDGKFMLEIDSESDSLVFTSVGYKTKTVLAGTSREITVTMELDQTTLEDVVVVGFGQQKKLSVTGAISSVTAREIEQVSTPSLSNAIAGKLPGIMTRQAIGEPGYDAATVYIRGLGTWAEGGRNPLILVDGVERSMDNINPQEIESFSILKDASATAVYGVRGANGVILINTKRGKQGRPQITFRSETALLHPLRLPDYIDAEQYALLMNDGLARDGQPLAWDAADLEKFRTGSDPYLFPNVSWMDTLMRKNTYQTINNLSVSGGGEHVRYFTNVGYTDQNGIYKTEALNKYNTNANFKRYNFRSNVDIDLSDRLTIGLGIGGIIERGNFPGNSSWAIFDAIRNTSPIAFPMRNPDGSPGGISVYLGSNPWGVATQSGYGNQSRNTLQGTFSGKWDLSGLITEGLSVSGKFSFDSYYINQATRHKNFAVKQYIGKDEAGVDVYVPLREETPLGFALSNESNRAIYTEAMVNYQRSFGLHDVGGMFLFNQREYVVLTREGLNSVGNLPYRRRGLAGRFTYAYDNKYLAEINFGLNGSENFPQGRQYGFFPSVSAGWVLTNEDFWNIDFVNSLKLRGSYGQVGNDQVGGSRFLFLTTINNNAPGYFFGDNQVIYGGMSENQIGVNNVTWEVATKTNLGMDIQLLNGKISLQTDFFKERREGILIRRQGVPDYSGFLGASIPYGNLGIAENQGVDALLEIRNTTTSGFHYSFRTNFTYAHSNVIENDEPMPAYPYLSGKGVPIDAQWGWVSDGFFNSAEEIATWADQTRLGGTPKVGSVRYKDINGDGYVDDNDRLPIGLPRVPEITFGFGGTVAYKGFDASIYFIGAARTDLFLEGASMYPFATGMGIFNVLSEYYDNRWTPEHMDAKYPAVRNGNNPNDFRPSAIWMKDGSYLRLRNAEIGFTFPESWMNRARIKSLRVFVNGTNLYTWDHVKVIDPESNNGTGGYPLQMILNAGVQFNF